MLSFAAESDGDLSVLLSLPEDRKAMYEIAAWPMIAEFRSILDKWDTSAPDSFWRGRWFFGYTEMQSSATPVWVRCEGAITFGFTAAEWASIQQAFRRAWEMPELRAISGELMLAYGEL